MQISTLWNAQLFLPESQPNYIFSKLELHMAQSVFTPIKRLLQDFPDNEFYRDMGMLLPADIARYEQAGRVIPVTSDLLFGKSRSVEVAHLQRMYGTQYGLSVGALSFTTKGKASPFTVFEYLVKKSASGVGGVGSVEYVDGGNLVDPYIVLSNSKYLFYSAYVVRTFCPHIYTVSHNGGVTVSRHIINY